jgi:hypothetical protein
VHNVDGTLAYIHDIHSRRRLARKELSCTHVVRANPDRVQRLRGLELLLLREAAGEVEVCAELIFFDVREVRARRGVVVADRTRDGEVVQVVPGVTGQILAPCSTVVRNP